MTVDPKKLKALVDQNNQKKAPPPFGKKKGGGGPPGGGGGQGGGGGGGGGGKKPPHKEPDGDEDEEGHEPGDHNEDDEQTVNRVKSQLESGELDNSELEDHLDDIDEDGGAVPDWADSETWERAVKAVDPEGKAKDDEDPYRLVAYVYVEMGGKILDGDDDDDEHDDDGGE